MQICNGLSRSSLLPSLRPPHTTGIRIPDWLLILPDACYLAMIRLLPIAIRAARDRLGGALAVFPCQELCGPHRPMGGIARIAEAEKGNTKFSG